MSNVSSPEKRTIDKPPIEYVSGVYDPNKPIVWYLDDIRDNILKFADAHKSEFNVREFRKPSALLQALSSATKLPDAFLCDVFIYESDTEAATFEEYAKEGIEHLEDTKTKIGAEKIENLDGIDAMEGVRKFFKDRRQDIPFPMYAYTSKAPYLLGQSGWNRITEVRAVVLMKSRITRC
jgi:hypothetical protein